MNLFDLPSSLLVALFAYSDLVAASPTPTITQLATTGSGPDYASACLAASASYNAAYKKWNKEHEWISTTIEDLGGSSFRDVVYIANASTLCDGHPRVTQSNYSTLSTGVITNTAPVTGKTTILQTYFSAYNAPSPTCRISPSDCDPFWRAYSSSLTATGPQITSPPLTTPDCMNGSMAASVSKADSKVYGCGKCTIYGEGVQLVFWPPPTTVSRDMCASEPTANVTHYGPNAVITAYAGKSVGKSASANATVEASLQGYNTLNGKEIITADGHVFTAGTAYISISKVWAVDRCSKTAGTVVRDAILAMPSESILSLRYSQDKFQRFMETDAITGYPVNYADFRTPIPWSAWNGQNICQGPKDNYMCTVINENFFRPQLAIPPQITELSPEFEDCQMWYNGLWDPPLALTEANKVAKPTLPAYYSTKPEPASPSSTVPAPTATATALPNERPSSSASHSASTGPSKHPEGPIVAHPTLPAGKAPIPANEPWTLTFDFEGKTYVATGENNQAICGNVTCVDGGPAQTLELGLVVSYGPNGLVFDRQTTVSCVATSWRASASAGVSHWILAGQSPPRGSSDENQSACDVPDAGVVHSQTTLGIPLTNTPLTNTGSESARSSTATATNSQSTVITPSSASSPNLTPVLTSFLMVLFLGAVVIV